ncbi:MAG: ABC transporter permease [Nanoarchaeota archaeon]|nr:ABC transporter permease [Nanoarchaeota archaeon]
MINLKDLLYEAWVVSRREGKKKNQLKRFLLGYGSLFVMLGFILLLGGGFDAFVDFSKYGQSYSQFLSAGMMAYFLALFGLQTGSNLVIDREGFGKLFLVAPISRLSILLGTELYLMMGMIHYLIMIIVILLIFDSLTILSVLLILLFCIYVSMFFLSIGIWLSTLFPSIKTANQVLGWVNLLLFFLSGIMFPISAMPKIVQRLFVINPLTYVVDVFRYLMTGQHHYPLIESTIFLVLFGAVSIFLGTYMYDKNLRR